MPTLNLLSMKRYILIILMLSVTWPAWSQWSFKRMSGDTCVPRLFYQYAYSNYIYVVGEYFTQFEWCFNIVKRIPGGPTFDVYTECSQITLQTDSLSCRLIRLNFLTDQQGFLLKQAWGFYGVKKSIDMGESWSLFSALQETDFRGWYFLNENLGYAIFGGGQYQDEVKIYRLTEEHQDLIYDKSGLTFPSGEVNIIDSVADAHSCKQVNYIGFTIHIPDKDIDIRIWPREFPQGIPEAGNSAPIRIVPNPATDLIHFVATGNPFPVRIRGYSCLGQLLIEKKITGADESFNTSNLPRGFIYLDLIPQNGSPQRLKLLLQ